jgi:hypothetical protein
MDRKPASNCTSCNSCHTHGHDKWDILYLHPRYPTLSVDCLGNIGHSHHSPCCLIWEHLSFLLLKGIIRASTFTLWSPKQTSLHTAAATASDHMSFPTLALESIHTSSCLVLTVNILMFVQTVLYTNRLFARTCSSTLARAELAFEKCTWYASSTEYNYCKQILVLALQVRKVLLLFIHLFIHRSWVIKIKFWSGHFRKKKHFLLLPGNKPQFLSCQVHSLASIPTALSRLMANKS